jgi:peptidoglycan/xylan/chitin deacetylase (PgdA/CDA1 family)
MTKDSKFLLDQFTVLMYHGIKTDAFSVPMGREFGAEIYDVPLVNFKAQMELINNAGFQVVKVEKESISNQNRQIVITFDDGEMNNFTFALPVLYELGFPAYFFVIANRVGKPGYMDWDNLHRMCETGMVVGSHGLTHSILTNLSHHQLEEELYGSREYLEKHIGRKISALSIPRGFCNDKIIQMAYEAGYNQVFISDRPKELKSKCWKRVAVKGSWNIKRFEQAINGIEPISEQFLSQIKQVAKRSLKDDLYSQIRNMLINASQLKDGF